MEVIMVRFLDVWLCERSWDVTLVSFSTEVIGESGYDETEILLRCV
jgi:hypothetical protein